MKPKTIAIIFGGNSSEYGVSLDSAYAVLCNIPHQKYSIYMIGITRLGKWYHYDGDINKIKDGTWWQEKSNPISVCLDADCQVIIEFSKSGVIYQHIDAVFPILHGKNGEDGTIQGLFQLANIPLIGCDALSSALCMDKQRAHQLVEASGIKVTKSVVLKENRGWKEATNDLKLPLFVKPIKAGSSYGITKVSNRDDLKAAIDYAFEYYDEVIVEEEVLGFEVGCAVIGINQLKTGRVDEIELSGGFFDFNEKYTLKNSKIHMPARIDIQTEQRIQETAKLIYQVLGCKVFARVDMFLTPELEIVFNEVNTIPGFTSHSRFPQMMKGAGYEFSDVIETIIEMGLNHENHYIK